MLGPWLHEIESLEAICQDVQARRIFLRMAALSRGGRMNSFLAALERDQDVDVETKGMLADLAQDATLLLAVEDYLERTQVHH
jgi:hypothetical protein